MKILHLYAVELLDGTRYQGEIAYKDDEKIVLRQRLPEQKLRIFNASISSIRDIGWKKIYVVK